MVKNIIKYHADKGRRLKRLCVPVQLVEFRKKL